MKIDKLIFDKLHYMALALALALALVVSAVFSYVSAFVSSKYMSNTHHD